MSTLLYVFIFTLFVMNLIVGVFIWFHVATVAYNRYRFGTDTAPKQTGTTRTTTSADEVAAIMAAWRAARQSEEETVPRLRA